MAKIMCIVLGAVFLIVGIVGLSDSDLLGAHLTPVHNLIHLVSGAVALSMGVMGSLTGARRFCFWFGVFYWLLGFAGFLLGTTYDRIMTVIPAELVLGNMDHSIHLLVGSAFVLGALATEVQVRTNAVGR